MTHALVIGGTGMLRGVCLHLAGVVDTVSVVARNAQRLETLASQGRRMNKPGEINVIAADYAKTDELHRQLRKAITENGPVTLAVAWVRSNSAGVLPGVCKILTERGPCRVFQVMGSTAADPSQPSAEDEPLRAMAGIRHRRVILGFIVEPGGGSRWLNNTEIAAGIIRAIELDEPEAVVGVVRPWSARPGD